MAKERYNNQHNKKKPKIMRGPKAANRFKSMFGWVKFDPSSKKEKQARRKRREFM